MCEATCSTSTYKALNHLFIFAMIYICNTHDNYITTSCLEHKSLLFKVTCKKTVMHHTDYRGRPMCSIATSIWKKIHILG